MHLIYCSIDFLQSSLSGSTLMHALFIFRTNLDQIVDGVPHGNERLVVVSQHHRHLAAGFFAPFVEPVEVMHGRGIRHGALLVFERCDLNVDTQRKQVNEHIKNLDELHNGG